VEFGGAGFAFDLFGLLFFSGCGFAAAPEFLFFFAEVGDALVGAVFPPFVLEGLSGDGLEEDLCDESGVLHCVAVECGGDGVVWWFVELCSEGVPVSASGGEECAADCVSGVDGESGVSWFEFDLWVGFCEVCSGFAFEAVGGCGELDGGCVGCGSADFEGGDG